MEWFSLREMITAKTPSDARNGEGESQPPTARFTRLWVGWLDRNRCTMWKEYLRCVRKISSVQLSERVNLNFLVNIYDRHNSRRQHVHSG